MGTASAVIIIISVLLIGAGIFLFFGGMVANNGSEARATGIRVNFSLQTTILLLLGCGLYFIAGLSTDPLKYIEQLPATSAGSQLSHLSSDRQSYSQPELEEWLKNHTGIYYLEVSSDGKTRKTVTGSMLLNPLGNQVYYVNIRLSDDEYASGLPAQLYRHQQDWYLHFEGLPTDTLVRPVKVNLEAQGDFLVMSYAINGTTIRHTWRHM